MKCPKCGGEEFKPVELYEVAGEPIFFPDDPNVRSRIKKRMVCVKCGTFNDPQYVRNWGRYIFKESAMNFELVKTLLIIAVVLIFILYLYYLLKTP